MYINSSGPHTYINTFKWADGNVYHYQEFFAEQFCNRNIAYCSYSTRGVEIIEDAPFLKINDEEYNTYLLSNSIKDIETNVKIDGLLLNGYCNENLKDTLIWQLSGNSIFTMWSGCNK